MAEPQRKIIRLSEHLPPKTAPLYRRPPPNTDIEIVWPSGAGREIGVFRDGIDAVWDLLKANHANVSGHFRMAEVEEEGFRAVVILGLFATPVSFAEEDIEGLEGLSIVVDENAQLGTVIANLQALVGEKADFESLQQA